MKPVTAIFLGCTGKRLLTAWLAVVLAVTAVPAPAPAMGKRTPSPLQTRGNQATLGDEGTGADAQKMVESAKDFRYDATGKRDPFFPLVTPDGRLTAPTTGTDKAVVMLEGILWDPGGDSAAMINGAVIEPGDAVEGYRVVTIMRDGVVLERDGHVIKVQLAVGELDGPGEAPSESTR